MLTETKASYSSQFSRDDITISDREILQRYLSISQVPCVISSPLRDDDEKPSFSVYEKGGKLLWKDFGTGEGGDIVFLLAKLWSLTYGEALSQIRADYGQIDTNPRLLRKYRGKIHVTHGSGIKVKVREWKSWDRKYWNMYGISIRMCKKCRVYPISHAFFSRKEEDGTTTTVCVPMEQHAYAYFEWKDGKESIKLYQPYSQKMKWLSKHDSSVWDLWEQAFKYADTGHDKAVILTSSRKDAMCLWQNLGVPAMSLQGEGYIPKKQVMQQVLDRFENVYIWYDNDYSHTGDNPGQDNAKKLIEMFPKLQNICIPEQYESKDPSDLYKNHGKDALKEVWWTQTKWK